MKRVMFASRQGFTLIETLIAIAILVIIVFGVMGALIIGIKIIGQSKARVGAVSLTNKRMEMLRNLIYNDIGTVGGIPAGAIPQEETITLNGVEYTLKTSIQYVDDPADGEGGNDENGIVADYKKARVETSWSGKYTATPVVAVSNFAPKDIETDVGGGTLIINVFDDSVQPVGQANVHIVNSEVDPAIDTNAETSDQGRVVFPGSPSVGKYQITITKITEEETYSSAQTYNAVPGNPNPDPGHLTILEGETTEATFFIDLVSSLAINTVGPKGESIWDDYFISDNKVFESSNMDIGGGEAKLGQIATEQYYPSGYLISTTVDPTYLVDWIRFSFDDNEATDTDISYQALYHDGADWVLLPEDVLSGNTVGFDDSPIDLSGVDPIGYPRLRLKGNLSTASISITPILFDWQVRWNDNVEVPLGNVSFDMIGTKTIGEGVYKYSQTHTTNSIGHFDIYNLEWDIYDISSTKIGAQLYDIAASLLPEPINIKPDTSNTLKLTLVPHASHTLLVTVKNAVDELLINASVRLFRTGYDETIYTGESGQSFFTPLQTATNYSFRVSKAGYQDYSLDDIEVDEQSEITVIMTSL